MHRDKIVARILLIFSVANVALAAPAVVREIRLDIAEAALEKRVGSDQSTGESVFGALSDSDSDPHFPDSASPAVSFHGDPYSTVWRAPVETVWSQDWEPAAPAHHNSAHELPSGLPHQDSAPRMWFHQSRHFPTSFSMTQ
jgi:hypothetical protein